MLVALSANLDKPLSYFFSESYRNLAKREDITHEEEELLTYTGQFGQDIMRLLNKQVKGLSQYYNRLNQATIDEYHRDLARMDQAAQQEKRRTPKAGSKRAKLAK